jgi:hypothetical protein
MSYSKDMNVSSDALIQILDYYHMNWGYDGNNNGWYTQGASMLGYDYGRMSLIDIRPN